MLPRISLAQRAVLTLALPLAIAAPRSSAAQGASTAVATHVAAAELRAIADSMAARAAREPGRQVPGRFVARDSALSVVVLRRDTSSRPEVHERVADVFVIQSGRATVVSGGRVDGARLVEPGEWNGGRIVPDSAGGAETAAVTRRAMTPGDLVMIPAGVPHQVEVANGEFVTYLVFKVPLAQPPREP